jgi:hypothetical protein
MLRGQNQLRGNVSLDGVYDHRRLQRQPGKLGEHHAIECRCCQPSKMTHSAELIGQLATFYASHGIPGNAAFRRMRP